VGGVLGLIAGFFGAFITHELYSWGTIDLGSQLAAELLGRDHRLRRRRQS
jgi:hypothetical protein